jgi:hypothetical protein
MFNTIATKATSARQYLRALYEPLMDTAVPGDIAFYISNSCKPAPSLKTRIYRLWLGFDPSDYSTWHTVVYVGAKKSVGEQRRPYVIHSTRKGNTVEEHLKPSYFSFKARAGQEVLQCRTEVIHFPEISTAQRKKIVEYCRAQVGKPFDGDGWQLDFATYVFGIRSRERNSDHVSCHGLAFNAYGWIGLLFPHPPLRHAPNLLGRLVGHPLGHPADHVDLRYNYLRDHHLYTDQRGKISIALVGHGPKLENVEVKLNPGRYSWNPALHTAYNSLAVRAYGPSPLIDQAKQANQIELTGH